MNNKKKKQNGFTIVELVIVIAVIGILAAVLIPTFSNLVKKAKQSADQQLVYHINEAVVANETDNIAKGKNATESTMYETLKKLESEYGFTIEKMTPRSGNDIVWDSTTNRFALVAKNGTVIYTDSNRPTVDMANKAQMWRITEAGESLTDGYAHYLTKGWSGEVPAVATGVDVGDNDDITAVTYDSSSDASAVVRTNGGELVINAPNGELAHYGYADKVDIKAVKTSSYTENGIVPFINIKTGNIKLTTESEVQVIHIEKNERPTNAAASTPDTYSEVIVTVTKNATIPTFTRDETVIDQTNGTKVCTIVTDQAKDVYLFQNGLYEQIKVADQGSNELVWIDSSNANNDTSNAAVQLANNWSGESEPVWENSETRTLSTEDVTNFVEDNGMSQKQANTLSKTAGGKGTQAEPYLISTTNHWNTIYEILHDAATNNKGVQYFKLMADIDFANFTIDNSPINGDTVMPYIDGNGHTLSNIVSFTWKKTLFNNVRDFTIKNATLNFDINYDNTGAVYCGAIANSTYGTCLFENITTLGDLRGFCGGGFLSVYADQQYGSVTFRNVTNYTNMNTTADYANPFGAHCMSTASPIFFENCKNYGTIIGKSASGFVGMDGGSPNAHFRFADENAVINYGKIYGSVQSGHFTYSDTGATKTVNGVTANIKSGTASLNTIGTISINVPEEGNISIPAVASATRYTISLNVSTQYYEDRWEGWGGNYPIGISKEYSADEVSNGQLSFGFGKLYLCENNNDKIHSASDKPVSYEGIFYDELNVNSLSENNYLMGTNTSALSVISVNDKVFLYANNEEYRALLNKGQIENPSKTVWVSITVTAFNGDSILASGSTHYEFAVETAREYFAN